MTTYYVRNLVEDVDLFTSGSYPRVGKIIDRITLSEYDVGIKESKLFNTQYPSKIVSMEPDPGLGPPYTLLLDLVRGSDYYRIPDKYTYFQKGDWEFKGFTPSNLSTFKSELCTRFEVAHKYDAGWDSRFNSINLYLLSFIDPRISFTFYVPIFYPGSDNIHGEIITI